VLTVNQFFTAGQVVARSDLLTVLPRHFIASTGIDEQLSQRPLPMTLPQVHVHMLWHRRQESRASTPGCARRFSTRRGADGGCPAIPDCFVRPGFARDPAPRFARRAREIRKKPGRRSPGEVAFGVALD